VAADGIEHGTAASGEAEGVDAEDAREELAGGVQSIESGRGRGGFVGSEGPYSYECDLSPTILASRFVDLTYNYKNNNNNNAPPSPPPPPP